MGCQSAMANPAVKDEILACLPQLRAFARSLARDRDQADDLVQDAIVRAISSECQYSPGTNFKAWMFTILRNLYFNSFRRKYLMRPLEPSDLETHSAAPTQLAGLGYRDFKRAFNELPADQREALVLVGADGFKYEEAAAISGCAVGTMKSRVSRARRELESKLDMDRTTAREPAAMSGSSDEASRTAGVDRTVRRH